MNTLPVTVRAAGPADLEALVELRRENGRVHAALDPQRYRVPEAAAVRESFARALLGRTGGDAEDGTHDSVRGGADESIGGGSYDNVRADTRHRADHPASGGGDTGPLPEATVLVLVAVAGDRVVGMAELVPSPPPPPDQILVPVPGGQVHVVVSPRARGRGVGTLLRQAVENAARERGLRQLVAPIHAANGPALAFYSPAGYQDLGRLTVKGL